MKEIFQGILLFLALTFIAIRSEADALSDQLASLFASEPARFIAYERVAGSHASEYGDMRYLVMDFSFRQSSEALRQGAVHAICSQVLDDVALLTELSLQGVNMVSVSFDRQSQYDCL